MDRLYTEHNSRDGEPMLFKFVNPPQQEQQRDTQSSRVRDDGGADQESDAGSLHIEVLDS